MVMVRLPVRQYFIPLLQQIATPTCQPLILNTTAYLPPWSHPLLYRVYWLLWVAYHNSFSKAWEESVLIITHISPLDFLLHGIAKRALPNSWSRWICLRRSRHTGWHPQRLSTVSNVIGFKTHKLGFFFFFFEKRGTYFRPLAFSLLSHKFFPLQ